MTKDTLDRFGIDEYEFTERAGIYQYDGGYDIITATYKAFSDLNNKGIKCNNQEEFKQAIFRKE